MALFLAVLGGCLILAGYNPIDALQIALFDQIGATVMDPFNQKILIFTSSLIGLVHVCVASGGIPAFVRWISRKSKSRRRTQATTVALGTAIFFDDYANTMVVGSSMQPLADKTQTSREKLAYLVDATSAPIAGIAFISSWIGYEIGLFQSFGPEKLKETFGEDVSSGFSVFLHSMPYRFYCILTLGFVIMLVWSRRDYGPMLRAERRVAKEALDEPPAGANVEDKTRSARAIDGVLPILITLLGIVGAFAWLAITAPEADAKDSMPPILHGIQFASDQMMDVLAWAGALGAVFSIGWAWRRTTLTLGESVGAFMKGLKILAPTLGILVLAITMRSLTDALGTGTFLAALLHNVPGEVLPMAEFVLAGVVAFATGSSWATMGLLIPVALPMAHIFVVQHGAASWVPLATAASVLDGSIFGDHCSPISDTTVMSSAATGCNHIDHVRTQLPYALTVMVAAMACGYGISVMFTGGPFLGYALGLTMLAIIIRVLGRFPNARGADAAALPADPESQTVA
jgi:Na+/H+ antiporter NhaC